MLDLKLSRRKFLHASGSTLVGVIAASSGTLSLLAPSRTWALELSNLDATSGQILLLATRHIYPHATLDDAVYALEVKELDKAAADDATAKMLTKGVAALNLGADGDWYAAEDEKQLDILSKMSDSEFFQKIRGTAVVALYNNDMAWAHFGYQGDAWSEGGYLERGFNDLSWLPDPPAEASPPAFIGK